MLARSLLFMHPRPGCREDLVATFDRLRIPQTALQQDGCLSVEMQVPPEDEAPVLVTALWAHRDAYQGWLDNPRRADGQDELFALLSNEPEGVVYDIRVHAGNPVPAGDGA